MTLAAQLRSDDPNERAAAIAAVAERGRIEADELAALTDCLGHARKAVQRPAAEALAGLAALGIPIEAALDRALASPFARQRWGAAFALSLLGDPPPRTLPVVLETLGADDGDMRWAAAAILLRLKDRATLVPALRDLVASGNPAQRKMALYCLRDLDARFPDVEEAVLSALGDEEWDVRLAAITTLGRLSIDRAAAAERLIVALEVSDERGRRAAAAALGALGVRSAQVVEALRAVVSDADSSLRRAAERALRQLETV